MSNQLPAVKPEIVFDCPHCGQSYRSETDRAGADFACTNCGREFAIAGRNEADKSALANARQALLDQADELQSGAQSSNFWATVLFVISGIAFLLCFIDATPQWKMDAAWIAAGTFAVAAVLTISAQLIFVRARLLRLQVELQKR